jgi:hypothetical protein
LKLKKKIRKSEANGLKQTGRETHGPLFVSRELLVTDDPRSKQVN